MEILKSVQMVTHRNTVFSFFFLIKHVVEGKLRQPVCDACVSCLSWCIWGAFVGLQEDLLSYKCVKNDLCCKLAALPRIRGGSVFPRCFVVIAVTYAHLSIFTTD